MVFHLSLGNSKFPQFSRTLHNIQTDLNNTVVWIISNRPPISNSSTVLSKPWQTVPSSPITNGITVTLMFHSFLISRTRFKYSSPFSLSLIFVLWSIGTTKSTIQWSVWIRKFQGIFCVSFSWTDSGLCINNFLLLLFLLLLFIYLLCFLVHLFWQSSHINLKKKILPSTYILLIQYLYTDQILLSNSSESSKNAFLNTFSYHYLKNHPIQY